MHIITIVINTNLCGLDFEQFNMSDLKSASESKSGTELHVGEYVHLDILTEYRTFCTYVHLIAKKKQTEKKRYAIRETILKEIINPPENFNVAEVQHISELNEENKRLGMLTDAIYRLRAPYEEHEYAHTNVIEKLAKQLQCKHFLKCSTRDNDVFGTKCSKKCKYPKFCGNCADGLKVKCLLCGYVTVNRSYATPPLERWNYLCTFTDTVNMPIPKAFARPLIPQECIGAIDNGVQCYTESDEDEQ